MPKDPLALYLVLTPEFGGTRFGPFEGLEVRIGSDASRSDITVPESLGARPAHAKVIQRGRDAYLLSPAERSAGLWLWQGAARRPTQVTSPTAIQHGDSFALVTPEGPRFRVELGPLPADILAKRKPSPYRRRYGPAVWFAEIRRLVIARFYTFSFVSLAARGWYAITSGAIFHPRILLPFLAIMSGYSACGVTSCSAMRFRSQATTATVRHEKCQEKLGYAENLSKKVEDWTFDQLAAVILEAVDMGPALQGNDQLLEAVRSEATSIAANPRAYAWITAADSRQDTFARWRERIDSDQGIDATTRKLAAYLAATPDRLPGEWEKLIDTQDEAVCGRGPIRLSWRQANSLGLPSVQLDAYFPGDGTATDIGTRAQALARTAQKGNVPMVDTPQSEVQVLQQGAASCVFVPGPDDRDDIGKLARMVQEQVGTKAKYLPSAGDSMGAVARIAKLVAADVPAVDWRRSPPEIDLKAGFPGPLKKIPGGDKVLARTAEVIARAIVLPCDAVLNGDPGKMAAIFGDLPDAIPCLVLNYQLGRRQ